MRPEELIEGMNENPMSRVEVREGKPVLCGGSVPLDALMKRLESGEGPAEVAQELGLEAADVVAAIGFVALGAGPDDGPTLVHSAPPHPKLAQAVSEAALARLLPSSPHAARGALVAGLCQVLDFWEESHEAAQQADERGETAVSAYWHGVAHRREPDAGNAAYWFRRVGQHACFAPLAEAARPLLEKHGDAGLTARLCPKDRSWDPFAMIDLCTSARRGTAQESLGRSLQRLEMQVLLEATAAAALR
jgi:uncharacterized protein (DUF433 family)